MSAGRTWLSSSLFLSLSFFCPLPLCMHCVNAFIYVAVFLFLRNTPMWGVSLFILFPLKARGGPRCGHLERAGDTAEIETFPRKPHTWGGFDHCAFACVCVGNVSGNTDRCGTFCRSLLSVSRLYRPPVSRTRAYPTLSPIRLSIPRLYTRSFSRPHLPLLYSISRPGFFLCSWGITWAPGRRSSTTTPTTSSSTTLTSRAPASRYLCLCALPASATAVRSVHPFNVRVYHGGYPDRSVCLAVDLVLCDKHARQGGAGGDR